MRGETTNAGDADPYVIDTLLTVMLSPIFPVNAVTATHAAHVSWRRRDYTFIVGAATPIVLCVVRNAFVGAVTAAVVAALYHILWRKRPKDVEVPLWFMGGLSITVIYFMKGFWNVLSYVTGFRAWWSSPSDHPALIPIHFVFTITALVMAYVAQAGVSGGRLGALVKYLKESPGAAPVSAFMALLVFAAALLAKGFEVAANKAAELAYYFLVTGVALQLYAAVKEGGEERGSD